MHRAHDTGFCLKEWLLIMTPPGLRFNPAFSWFVPLLSGDFGFESGFFVSIHDIFPRQWNCILPLGELYLENNMAAIPEGDLANGQIELPHAAETFVIEIPDF